MVGLARSDRTLLDWQPEPEPAIGTPDRPDISEVRDPFIFFHEGRRYAVQGAGRREGPPQLLVYDCADLQHWIELGPLLTDADPVAAEVAPAHIWECPNLVRVDGEWVLLISLWRWEHNTHQLAGVRYLLGDLVSEGGGLRFEAASGGVLDEGPAFYAPQAMQDGPRVLLWGWAWELDRSHEQVVDAGWAGALTFPRELYLREGRLASRPAAELTGLRSGALEWTSGVGLAEPAFELAAVGPVELRLVDGERDDLVAEAAGEPGEAARILVDGSVIETYSGGVTRTTRAYPTSTSRWVITGAADDVTAYRLGGTGAHRPDHARGAGPVDSAGSSAPARSWGGGTGPPSSWATRASTASRPSSTPGEAMMVRVGKQVTAVAGDATAHITDMSSGMRRPRPRRPAIRPDAACSPLTSTAVAPGAAASRSAALRRAETASGPQ